MRSFVPGIDLARAFYEEAVARLVGGVPHAAALLGTGSEVLGFDTERSTDHGWGPRLQLFVAREDVERVAEIIEAGLPEQFRGWPTRFGWDDVAVSHHVRVSVLEDVLKQTLGFDPRERVGVVDWLATPQQILLEVTRGGVFQDPAGELRAVRAALAWYPDDVWLWLLGCQWRRLDQEEPLAGRPKSATKSGRASLLHGSRATWSGSAFCSSVGTRRTANGSAPHSARSIHTKTSRRTCSMH